MGATVAELTAIGRAAILIPFPLAADDHQARNADALAGAGGALRIIVSTNTATIHGSAPVGEQIFALRIDQDTPFPWTSGAQADQNGQYTFAALPPGKYRLALMGAGGPIPDEGGQEVTVQEGETVMVELKPQTAQ